MRNLWYRDLAPQLTPLSPIARFLERSQYATRRNIAFKRALLRELQGYMPFPYVHQLTLTPQQTLEDRFNVIEGGKIVALTAASSKPAGFRVVLFDAKRKHRFASLAVNAENMAGTAQRQFFLLQPYRLSPGTELAGRYVNLDTGPGNSDIQLLFLVYR